LTTVTKDGSKTQTNTVKWAINTTNNKESGQFTLAEGSSSAAIDFDITPSSKNLNVSAPQGAQSIASILDLLGLNTPAAGTQTSATDLSTLQGL
jgi:hypothetical protein